MIAPTEPGRGGAASIDVDSLAVASGGAVTEADVAVNGANEGDVVGDLAWTLGEIADTGGNNVNDLVNELGLGEGDVNDHSSYALITLESATAQAGVEMKVGSDDSIKVWMNREVVHTNAVNRGAGDFQDTFEVDLVAGDNLLLVKVSERGGEWSMFVGIAANVNAVYKPPASPVSGGLRFSPSTVANQTFTVGTYVSLTLPSATGGTPPYIYTSSALPAGLQFDAATRHLSGTPTTASSATPVTYTATDAAGRTASLSFTISFTLTVQTIPVTQTLQSDEFDGSGQNLQPFWHVQNSDRSPHTLRNGNLVVEGGFWQNLWIEDSSTRFYQVTDWDRFTVETSMVFDHRDVCSIAGLVISSPTTQDAQGRDGE